MTRSPARPGHFGADGDDGAGCLVADRVGAGEQSPRDHRRVEVAAGDGEGGDERGVLVGELRI